MKYFLLTVGFLGFSFFLLARDIPGDINPCGKADLSTDKSRYSYAIGIQIGSNVKRQGIEIDINSLAAGILDAIKDNKVRLTDDEIKKVMANLSQMIENEKKRSADNNKRANDEYLDKNRSKNGVIVTKSGLQYEITAMGNGDSPLLGDRVRVHYRGTLINGKEFDNTYSRNQPAEFQVSGTIPGFMEALLLMKKGSRFKLTIPYYLAYGEGGTVDIPGNSVLIFEVELIEISTMDGK